MSDIGNISNSPLKKHLSVNSAKRKLEGDEGTKAQGKKGEKNSSEKSLMEQKDLYIPSERAQLGKLSSDNGENPSISKEDLNRFVAMLKELPDDEMSADEVSEIQEKMERYGEEALQGTVDAFLEEQVGIPPRG